jgi:hypothetical protein
MWAQRRAGAVLVMTAAALTAVHRHADRGRGDRNAALAFVAPHPHGARRR